jgi:hypothetical protein
LGGREFLDLRQQQLGIGIHGSLAFGGSGVVVANWWRRWW